MPIQLLVPKKDDGIDVEELIDQFCTKTRLTRNSNTQTKNILERMVSVGMLTPAEMEKYKQENNIE